MSRSSIVARTQQYLKNIALTNGRINAIIAHHPDSEVLEQAKRSESHNGADLIVGIKDNFCTTDLPTTCASKALEGFYSPYESTVTGLLKSAGAVDIGKLNMDEFAMGTDNIFSTYGPTVNPLFEVASSPGGSSGGSAAAVAAKYCDVALGSDTGGSVRLPAAYCSVLGFKPTYGLVSRYGLVSYAQSLDTVGLLARDIKKLREAFKIINKFDRKDPTSLPDTVRAEIAARPRKTEGLTIGIVEEAIIDLEPEVREAWAESLAALEAKGHTLKVISIPSLKHAIHTYFMLSPAEASSNLARYDGIRYGHRAATDEDGPEGILYGSTRSEGFGAEVKRRILLGTYNLSSAEFDVHFLQAQKVRRIIVNEINSAFSTRSILAENDYELGTVDVIVHPTSRGRAPALEEVKRRDPVENYINDVLTIPANLAGIPAMSLPWGQSIGIQVWGQYGDDELVLDVSEQLIKASPFKNND